MQYGGIEDSVFATSAAVMKDLPDVEYDWRKPGTQDRERRKRRPDFGEISVYSFPQTWGSTALGFGGIGGSAMSTAQTTVVIEGHSAAIYFGRRLAYVIDDISAKIMEDIASLNIAEVGKQSKYSRTSQEKKG